MNRRIVLVMLFAAIWPAWGAEAIAGSWLLKTQQVAGEEAPVSRPLTLRVTASGDALQFEYSVTAGQKQEISLRFTARLNGAEADVKNFAGTKIGTARVTRGGASTYLITLQGANRPTSSGKMTVSNNGKTLVSESDAIAPGGKKTHTTQIFERQ